MSEHEALFTRLPGALLPWYRAHARDLPWRRDREPYHVWLSEIMLQQTRVEAARGYYARFLAALPDIPALAAAPEDELLKLWEGLGYYSRARNLRRAANVIMEEHGGVFPRDPAAIRALPGVGPYTAGAVASICFELPTPAVDGNVLRLLARLTEDPAPVNAPQARRLAEARLAAVYPAGACGDFTQALMELGALVCTPRGPRCGDCPLRQACLAAQNGAAAQYPRRLPRRARRAEERTVLLLWCGGELALTRREDSGLLAGLWQPPDLPGTLDAPAALAAAAALGARPVALLREQRRSHSFTHIQWALTGYHIECACRAPGLVWAAPEALRDRYGLPTAYRQFLDGPDG